MIILSKSYLLDKLSQVDSEFVIVSLCQDVDTDIIALSLSEVDYNGNLGNYVTCHDQAFLLIDRKYEK